MVAERRDRSWRLPAGVGGQNQHAVVLGERRARIADEPIAVEVGDERRVQPVDVDELAERRNRTPASPAADRRCQPPGRASATPARSRGTPRNSTRMMCLSKRTRSATPRRRRCNLAGWQSSGTKIPAPAWLPRTHERSSSSRRTRPQKRTRKGRANAPRPRAAESTRGARAGNPLLLGETPRRRDLLIEYLHRIQDRSGCLAAAHLVALAYEMKMAMAEVYEVATFYHHFDVVREGDSAPPAITVRVCDSIGCDLAGSRALLQALPGNGWARRRARAAGAVRRPLRDGTGRDCRTESGASRRHRESGGARPGARSHAPAARWRRVASTPTPRRW